MTSVTKALKSVLFSNMDIGKADTKPSVRPWVKMALATLVGLGAALAAGVLAKHFAFSGSKLGWIPIAEGTAVGGLLGLDVGALIAFGPPKLPLTKETHSPSTRRSDAENLIPEPLPGPEYNGF